MTVEPAPKVDWFASNPARVVSVNDAASVAGTEINPRAMPVMLDGTDAPLKNEFEFVFPLATGIVPRTFNFALPIAVPPIPTLPEESMTIRAVGALEPPLVENDNCEDMLLIEGVAVTEEVIPVACIYPVPS